jgi:hypothetical protein
VHDIKAYWGVEEQLHSILTSVLDQGEWAVSATVPPEKNSLVPTESEAVWAPQPDDALKDRCISSP